MDMVPGDDSDGPDDEEMAAEMAHAIMESVVEKAEGPLRRMGLHVDAAIATPFGIVLNVAIGDRAWELLEEDAVSEAQAKEFDRLARETQREMEADKAEEASRRLAEGVDPLDLLGDLFGEGND